MIHPSWCDPDRCRAELDGGTHRSAVRTVGDIPDEPLAKMWRECANGDAPVCAFSAGADPALWTADDLRRILGAGETMLRALEGTP